jgi:UDP-N-acetylmuramate--alanine ligase
MRLKSCIAIAGTHGKTTTTSMVAALLDAGSFDPTVINGGIINAYGTNARLGGGTWMVVEADESDGTFLKLPADVAIVTNIDPEHLDHYGSFDRVKDSFVEFVENVPFYGVALLCLDHPEVQAIIPRVRDRRIVTYGFSTQADVRAENVRPDNGGNCFDVVVRNRDGETRRIENIALPMAGRHNVQNALAAVGVGLELGIADEAVAKGFAGFSGVNRRFTHVGEVAGVTVIDDYGHHPVEIRAALSAAKERAKGKVFAVMQPHRYSRLRDLLAEFEAAFNDADGVFVTPVYAAGEDPIPGVDSEALVAGLKERGHRSARTVASEDELAALLGAEMAEGDMIVCLGAGDITKWAARLPEKLEGARA